MTEPNPLFPTGPRDANFPSDTASADTAASDTAVHPETPVPSNTAVPSVTAAALSAPSSSALVRERLVLALDVADLDQAQHLAEELREYFAVVKVGLELFCSAGPKAIDVFVEEGFAVFADLKLHDIPTTVGRAAKAIAAHRPSYVSVHTSGGEQMVRAFVEGLAEGAAEKSPVGLGITVLTSDLTAPSELLSERAGLGARAGLGGLVCAGPDLSLVRKAAPSLLTVVPGTRPVGVASNDQARVMSPHDAFAAGADLLVIGRAVTHDDDPRRAAAALVDSLS